MATRRHTVWHGPHPAEPHARLSEGASLALDSVDELHPPIARLAEAIERDLRTRVQAHLYASWTSTEGFGVHWDDHDTVIVQLDGAKRWRIYGTTRPFPLYRDIEGPGEAPTEPVADLVLRPGDVLYVQRGVCHALSADQGVRSLHVTCGLQTHTATDLLTWVSEQLLTHEDWRRDRDLPLLAPPDVQADAVDGMRNRIAELLDDPTLIARYTAAMDGQAVGRMMPNLPYSNGVPADGGLRVRLTTARAVLDVGDDAVTLSAAGTVYAFAPEAEAVLRPLVDGRTVHLATLADAAGLDVEAVAGLLQELVDGQAAGVGSLLQHPTPPLQPRTTQSRPTRQHSKQHQLPWPQPHSPCPRFRVKPRTSTAGWCSAATSTAWSRLLRRPCRRRRGPVP